jgi:hypothetical protein
VAQQLVLDSWQLAFPAGGPRLASESDLYTFNVDGTYSWERLGYYGSGPEIGTWTTYVDGAGKVHLVLENSLDFIVDYDPGADILLLSGSHVEGIARLDHVK